MKPGRCRSDAAQVRAFPVGAGADVGRDGLVAVADGDGGAQRQAGGGGVAPVPGRATVRGLPAALDVTIRIPVAEPVAVRAKVTLVVRDPPAAMEARCGCWPVRTGLDRPFRVVGLLAPIAGRVPPAPCWLPRWLASASVRLLLPTSPDKLLARRGSRPVWPCRVRPRLPGCRASSRSGASRPPLPGRGL